MAAYLYRPGHPKASDRGFVLKEEALSGEEKVEAAYVISDVMEPTRHMATGRMHTSKSEFRKDTRASGCVEIGNDTNSLMSRRKPVELSKRERVEHIKHAIRLLQSR